MKKNKGKIALIITILVMVIGVFGSFGLIIAKQSKNKQEDIKLSTGAITYNEKNEPYNFTSDGAIVKKGSKYYATSNKDYVCLGEHSVCYDGSSIRVLGGGYRIDYNGAITKITDFDTFSDFTNGAIYKLCDRKYLIVSNNIEGYQQNLEDDSVYESCFPTAQQPFLYIVMNTIGNASFIAMNSNFTTHSPTIIRTSNIVFDIANEKLGLGSEVFTKLSEGEYTLDRDLKSLIGSTNIYDSGTMKERSEEQTQDRLVFDIYGGNGGNAGNGGNGGDGGDGGDGGAGGAGQDQDVIAYIVNKGVRSTSTTITCDYYFEDPNGKLGKIFLELHEASKLPNSVITGEESFESFCVNEDGLYDDYWEEFNANPRRIECNFVERSTTFKDLKPNTTYYLLFCRYSDNYTTDTIDFNLEDEVIYKTKMQQNKMTINMLTPNSIIVDINLEDLNTGAFKVLIPDTAYEVALSEDDVLKAVSEVLTVTIDIPSDSSFMSQTEYINVQIVDADDVVICKITSRNNFYTGNVL